MSRIIFMTEEESMGITLRELFPKLFPEFLEFQHWILIHHKGKSDLESSFPKKMREWRKPDDRFIILRDNDGSNCSNLKQQLKTRVPETSPEFLIRIVCQELESWFIGDLDAVGEAYPNAKRHSAYKGLMRRNPDELTNASELIKELTGTRAKLIRAAEIAKKMTPDRNRSASFNVFVSGVRKLMSH